MIRARAAVIVLAVATAACVDSSPAGDPATGTTNGASATTSQAVSVVDRDEAVRLIQLFWAEQAPGMGVDDFEPLAPERIVAVDERDDVVPCDGEPLPMAVIADNAMAVQCAEGHTVLFDTALLDGLAVRFGPAAPAVVLAHEWGHVAQFQAAFSAPPVIVEQQADCYAGAWVGWATERRIPPFDAASTLDSVLAAVVGFRDEPGVSPADRQAHGSGFDRVRAFQEGFETGVAFCAGYADAPPVLVQLPFQPGEIATGGNLPLADAVELMSADLDRFFGGLVPGFEPVDPRSVADPDVLAAAHDEIGDNGVGLLLALGWSGVAQLLAGHDTAGDDPLRQRACLAGAWMGQLLDPPAEAQIRLSPGDLDEAIITFLERRGQAGAAEGLLVFELVASLRTGVTDGAPSCEL